MKIMLYFSLYPVLFINLFSLTMAIYNNNEAPIIELKKGAWSALETSVFARSTDGSAATAYPTFVEMMADSQHLHVRFACKNDLYVSQSNMTGHNEPLYEQAVFEMFIAAGTEDPSQYLEFEINPNNSIWVGKISNSGLGEQGSISAEMVGHDESGVLHQVEQQADDWEGSFSIPWGLISDEKTDAYRLNFYRIVSTKSQSEKNWVCTPDNCEFLCWNPTLSGEEPAFHRPKRFGLMVIGQ